MLDTIEVLKKYLSREMSTYLPLVFRKWWNKTVLEETLFVARILLSYQSYTSNSQSIKYKQELKDKKNAKIQ